MRSAEPCRGLPPCMDAVLSGNTIALPLRLPAGDPRPHARRKILPDTVADRAAASELYPIPLPAKLPPQALIFSRNTRPISFISRAEDRVLSVIRAPPRSLASSRTDSSVSRGSIRVMAASSVRSLVIP